MVDITTPTVGGDDDAWGDILNTALTTLESAVTAVESGKVSKAGDTLTGSLNLADGTQINIGASGSGAPVAVRRTNNTDATLSTRVGAEAASRFFIEAVGTHQWSDGTNSADTNLYRSAANVLKTDDALVVAGSLSITPSGTVNLGTDVNLYRASADVLQTDDYFVMPNGQANGSFSIFGGQPTSLSLGTLGGGIAVKEGANGRMGVATLVAGTVVVANTSVTANSRIFLTCQTPGGTPGFLRISARTASTSFTILSSSGTDTSVVAWIMFEPS